MRFLVASAITAGNHEKTEKQANEMTNRLHKDGIDLDSVCKGSENI
jgi:hypothetical protein